MIRPRFRIWFRGADDDGRSRRGAFHEADLLPGGQEDVAIRGVDDAAVGNIGAIR